MYTRLEEELILTKSIPQWLKPRSFRAVCDTTKQAAEKGYFWGQDPESQTSGAKAPIDSGAVAARLKPCPFKATTFPQPVKPCPFKAATFSAACKAHANCAGVRDD